MAGGERMAREQPAANFLYQAIDALSAVDKPSCASACWRPCVHPADALRTLGVPTLWLTGDEESCIRRSSPTSWRR